MAGLAGIPTIPDFTWFQSVLRLCSDTVRNRVALGSGRVAEIVRFPTNVPSRCRKSSDQAMTVRITVR